jgi:UDP-glucose 4-epimerase
MTETSLKLPPIKTLVVGGAGYIGSHMLLALQDAGQDPNDILVFDNLSRGHADACRTVPLFKGDLRSPNDLQQCFSSFRPDVVMHFGALAYVGESVQEPLLYYQNNVVGSLNLLAAMRDHSVNKLVFSSTCATYGEPQEVPIPEAHPQNPINPYGRTKLMIEQALKDYAPAYGLHSISLRYFNAAGADPKGRARERHDPETHLIPLVLQEAARVQAGGNPADTRLEVFGTDFNTPDGSCVRDYIHEEDLCQAHLRAAERLIQAGVPTTSSSSSSNLTQPAPSTGGQAANTPTQKNAHAEFFNLANGNGYSVLEVIETCRRITGQPIPARHSPRRAGDPACLVGQADFAAENLGWTPRHNLEKIIEDAWRV